MARGMHLDFRVDRLDFQRCPSAIAIRGSRNVSAAIAQGRMSAVVSLPSSVDGQCAGLLAGAADASLPAIWRRGAGFSTGLLMGCGIKL